MPAIEECSVGQYCRYSITQLGEERTRCLRCRFSPSNVELSDDASVGPSQWKPVEGSPFRFHPEEWVQKTKARRERQQVNQQKRLNRDRVRMRVSRTSAHAERKTETSFIQATRNSGRSRQDGDHVAAGFVTLDTKQQSQRLHPVVRLEELNKVRGDARRAGNSFGALVLRNQNGYGVAVMDERDFARLIEGIGKSHGETGVRGTQGADQGIPADIPGQPRH